MCICYISYMKNMIKNILTDENFFFIHYQCDDFSIGRKIHSLSVLVNGKEIQFSSTDEAENIKTFCDKVNELQRDGLIPIHWGQTKHHFGEAHIKNRFKELTNKNISLTYIEDINLSALLKNYYGERYIDHPRLDNLALLNKFNTVEQLENNSMTYASDRIKLISKIYFNFQRGTLRVIKPEKIKISRKDEIKNNLPKPQQQKNNEPNNVIEELHNNIFKGNSIYLFKKYFKNKSMTLQSRTDFRFLFEQMKKDDLIHNTVSLGQYIKFIGYYGYYEKELKAIKLDAPKNIQRTKDYNEYKDNLKITLK